MNTQARMLKYINTQLALFKHKIDRIPFTSYPLTNYRVDGLIGPPGAYFFTPSISPAPAPPSKEKQANSLMGYTKDGSFLGLSKHGFSQPGRCVQVKTKFGAENGMAVEFLAKPHEHADEPISRPRPWNGPWSLALSSCLDPKAWTPRVSKSWTPFSAGKAPASVRSDPGRPARSSARYTDPNGIAVDFARIQEGRPGLQLAWSVRTRVLTWYVNTSGSLDHSSCQLSIYICSIKDFSLPRVDLFGPNFNIFFDLELFSLFMFFRSYGPEIEIKIKNTVGYISGPFQDRRTILPFLGVFSLDRSIERSPRKIEKW